ncbi:MAG: 2-hydroxyacyl-CoA dehydratase [Candidatus Margulisiibacteriota bacterium]
MQKKIGITSTVPSEVIFAAGAVPVDLNNIFVNFHGEGAVKSPLDLIRIAEENGLPRNTCSWIKGIFGALAQNPDIREVVVVMRGDCSNVVALSDVLKHKNYQIIPFSYPALKDGYLLSGEIKRFMQKLGARQKKVELYKKELDRIRAKLFLLDELTWRENKVTGAENHFFLVSSSDFMSDPVVFEKKVDEFLSAVAARPPFSKAVRLGYVGVPPIVLDLYVTLEKLGARVVFNEVQAQFAMLERTDDIVEQYLMYTYPYDVFGRIVDIKEEIEKRGIQGIIHYVQSFCHHQIEDVILQKEMPVPVLTLECDRPGNLDLQNQLRLEAFVDLLKQKAR